MPQLSQKQRSQIQSLYRQRLSFRLIARKLKCHHTTVKKWVERGLSTSNKLPSPGRGRKRKASDEDMKTIESISEEHKYQGSRQLVHFVRDNTNIDINDRTLRRDNASFDFKWGKPRRTFVLKPHHKKARLLWAKAHLNEDWNNWIFTDEKLFTVGAKGVGQRYRRGQRPVEERDRWSGSMMLWWGIHSTRSFQPIKIVGTLKAPQYISILKRSLPRSNRRSWKFMQDGARSHTAKITKKFLDEMKVDWCCDWPAKSSDLNPMENIWSIVDRMVQQREPKNVAEMERYVKEEISRIGRDTIKKLIETMPDRIRAVIRAKGGHTKY